MRVATYLYHGFGPRVHPFGFIRRRARLRRSAGPRKMERRRLARIGDAKLANVPQDRIAARNDAPVRADGEFVLYWMIANRRLGWNFALDRAIEWARELKKPLVILEALRCDYPWASERIHRFVLDGMVERSERLQGAGIVYYPHVELDGGASKGLLEHLAARASLVVTDDSPAFFLPHMVRSAAAKLRVLVEAVDSNGLLPLSIAEKTYPTAFAFRRFLQKQLPAHLSDAPKAHPLEGLRLPRLASIPGDAARRWPPASAENLRSSEWLARLPVDHKVQAVATRGGEAAARALQRKFVTQGLARYAESRNEPEIEATSGLSPYLHFGHISSHEIFHAIVEREGWSERKLALQATGSRAGWWGASGAAETFLDQLVTWRELGFNMAARDAEYDRYESLPEWAKRTLAKHADDERPHVYRLGAFAGARTHDALWNAAQRQLVKEGRMHNYLRMLWGKKILEWSRTPEEALEITIELNNRYALDGRDPNSYSGIFWCLGRYDRPWGPERPIFGTVRYMSSDNTARKVDVRAYLRKYGE